MSSSLVSIQGQPSSIPEIAPAGNPFCLLDGSKVLDILRSSTDYFSSYSFVAARSYTLPSHPSYIPFQKFLKGCAAANFPHTLNQSDLQVIPDDAIKDPAFHQIHGTEAASILQLYDDIVQNKTSLDIQGSEEFKSLVLRDIQTLLTRPQGRKLLKVICALKRKIAIRHGKTPKMSLPDLGIVLNFKKTFSTKCEDSDGNVHIIASPSYMIFAHEIIHLLHYDASLNHPNCLPSLKVLNRKSHLRGFENVSEQLTILGIPGDQSIPCENSLRAEFDLMARVSHYRPYFHPFTPKDLPEIDLPNQDGITRIEAACKYNAYSEIRKLIAAGADTGNALANAILKDKKKLVDFLLDNGADPYWPDDYGDLPLHLAVREDKREIVQLLIDRGVSVHRRDSNGETPLEVALQEVCFDSALLLIKNGAPLTHIALEAIPAELRESFVKLVPPENMANGNPKETNSKSHSKKRPREEVEESDSDSDYEPEIKRQALENRPHRNANANRAAANH